MTKKGKNTKNIETLIPKEKASSITEKTKKVSEKKKKYEKEPDLEKIMMTHIKKVSARLASPKVTTLNDVYKCVLTKRIYRKLLSICMKVKLSVITTTEKIKEKIKILSCAT